MIYILRLLLSDLTNKDLHELVLSVVISYFYNKLIYLRTNLYPFHRLDNHSDLGCVPTYMPPTLYIFLQIH